MREGSVVSIHIAHEASAPRDSVPSVRAVRGRGVEGDPVRPKGG